MEKTNFNYKNPAEGRIPVIAWGAIPHGLNPTSKIADNSVSIFKSLEMANFTTALHTDDNMTNGTVPAFDQCIEQVKELNMTLLFRLNQMYADPSTIIPKLVPLYASQPKFAGWLVLDEPKPEELYDLNSNLYKAYFLTNQLDPDHINFFNLAVPLTLEINKEKTDYAVYLNDLNEIYHPALWCYDFLSICD